MPRRRRTAGFDCMVECLNGLLSLVSTSWQLFEDLGAEGATFAPVTRISVGGREKKSPGGRAAFRSLRGQGER